MWKEKHAAEHAADIPTDDFERKTYFREMWTGVSRDEKMRLSEMARKINAGTIPYTPSRWEDISAEEKKRLTDQARRYNSAGMDEDEDEDDDDDDDEEDGSVPLVSTAPLEEKKDATPSIPSVAASPVGEIPLVEKSRSLQEEVSTTLKELMRARNSSGPVPHEYVDLITELRTLSVHKFLVTRHPKMRKAMKMDAKESVPTITIDCTPKLLDLLANSLYDGPVDFSPSVPNYVVENKLSVGEALQLVKLASSFGLENLSQSIHKGLYCLVTNLDTMVETVRDLKKQGRR